MKFQTTASRLKSAMEYKNIKAQELADKAGINKSSISQYVNGSHTPSNINAGKLGNVLDVNPLWLMGFEVPMFATQKNPGEAGGMAERESAYLRQLERRVRDFNEEDLRRLLAFAEKIYELRKAEEELS